MRPRLTLAVALAVSVAASTAHATDLSCAEEPASIAGERFGAKRTGTLLLAEISVKRAWTVFDSEEFDLAAVRRGARVPRVFLAALPQDIHRLRTVQDKRRTFIRVLLPVILAVNERVASDRRYLLELRRRLDAGQTLPARGDKWLRAVAIRYKALGRDTRVDWIALIERVDVVPPSLALAQSIVESGWGASLPARRSNALFGMIGGNGTDTAKLAAFENIYASIAAYVHNLNTFGAYREYRRQRASLRAQGKWPQGHPLAITLNR
jgi:Bax protein